MKSGKFTLGYKSTLKSLRKGASKLVMIANNCPPLRKSEIEYYAMLAKAGVHHYSGSTFFCARRHVHRALYSCIACLGRLDGRRRGARGLFVCNRVQSRRACNQGVPLSVIAVCLHSRASHF